MGNAIQVNNLSVSYYGNQILNKVSFNMESGRLIGIIGPNGAGKSTLMKGMLGLIPTDCGTVTIDGKNVRSMRKAIAYVPQRATIDWDFPITVLETVVLGTYPSLGLFKRPGKKERAWAHECLEKVGMESYAHHQIGELSGGQQQRVFLARALAQQAEYFFLDEPFVGIDVTSEALIIGLLKELRDEGKTAFVVHHDLTKVKSYFDDLIIVNREIVGAGTVENVMQPETMKRAFKSQYSLWDSLEVASS
ncbi:metal ABC transporter ATP-binding protein [Savagea sp. SN6]|uniref:Metal ABC transporter ATP-binding protein n=1 Tax=Savagea serpentis TaxID=2785297 RepID=A0A8J7G2E7_9BACL|nr:metal ABC transporter ATP-binding protein [Savagea serpentis]MBF4499767.1 metal ABC transporter ATP-binding protein [Savagea serpentis]